MVCSAILEITGDLGCVRVTTSQENPKCQGVWFSEGSDRSPCENQAPCGTSLEGACSRWEKWLKPFRPVDFPFEGSRNNHQWIVYLCWHIIFSHIEALWCCVVPESLCWMCSAGSHHPVWPVPSQHLWWRSSSALDPQILGVLGICRQQRASFKKLWGGALAG